MTSSKVIMWCLYHNLEVVSQTTNSKKQRTRKAESMQGRLLRREAEKRRREETTPFSCHRLTCSVDISGQNTVDPMAWVTQVTMNRRRMSLRSMRRYWNPRSNWGRPLSGDSCMIGMHRGIRRCRLKSRNQLKRQGFSQNDGLSQRTLGRKTVKAVFDSSSLLDTTTTVVCHDSEGKEGSHGGILLAAQFPLLRERSRMSLSFAREQEPEKQSLSI